MGGISECDQWVGSVSVTPLTTRSVGGISECDQWVGPVSVVSGWDQ